LKGWAWKKVVPLLDEMGHRAQTVSLTGAGERVHFASKDGCIETAIEDVLNLDDFMLIGHSFADKVMAAVADRVPVRVKMIRYLDAFRPEKNVRTPHGSFNPNEFGSLKPDEWTIPLTKEILDTIGKDVQSSDREWILSMATPWLMKHWSETVTLSKNFDTVRRAYIFCTGGECAVDEILKGKWGKLDGPHKVIESGQWLMITKPDELVEDILNFSG